MENEGGTSAYGYRVFEINAGPTDSVKTLYAHEDVLCQSEVLRMIVHGGGKETEEGKITWKDWTISASEKFLDWLYTGDYKCPYPVEASKMNKTLQTATIESINSDVGMDPGKPHTPQKTSKKPTDTWVKAVTTPITVEGPGRKEKQSSAVGTVQFKDLTWSRDRPLKKLSQAEEFDKWTGHQLWTPDQLDYHATFMTHAELYNMACHYQLCDLKTMAWQRLKAVLVTVGRPTAGWAVIRNMVDLIHYAYAVTGDNDKEADPLRELVTTFVTVHFTSFEGTAVDDLMRSVETADREFVVDLLAKIKQEMRNMKENDSAQPSRKKAVPRKAKRAFECTEAVCANCGYAYGACGNCGHAFDEFGYPKDECASCGLTLDAF
ncbi:MAG: hypothetical protein Q9209_004577 [Squamulea sp. 1 TL-2023]